MNISQKRSPTTFYESTKSTTKPPSLRTWKACPKTTTSITPSAALPLLKNTPAVAISGSHHATATTTQKRHRRYPFQMGRKPCARLVPHYLERGNRGHVSSKWRRRLRAFHMPCGASRFRHRLQRRNRRLNS